MTRNKLTTNTYGFIDSASIHGALATLSVGRDYQVSEWDRQSLLETTYLLLFDKIGVVPGPGQYGGASGLYSIVVSALPSIEEHQFDRNAAYRHTRSWLTKCPDALYEAWVKLQLDDQLSTWQRQTAELFWIHHVRMHISLFNEEYIPNISKVLSCSGSDLLKVHRASESEKTIAQWLKVGFTSEDSQLARDAWIISALIRGRFHEYLASSSNLHLVSHPFRKVIERTLKSGPEETVYNSEMYFTKIVVGSAMLETKPERRVKVWIDNVNKARNAISLKAITLPNAAIDADAERHAAEAAKICKLPASPEIICRAIDAASSIGIGLLLALQVHPWVGPAGPIIVQTYKHIRSTSIGDDLSKIAFATRRRFKRLASTVPGRIKCKIDRPI